jgi:hypothetical protein
MKKTALALCFFLWISPGMPTASAQQKPIKKVTKPIPLKKCHLPDDATASNKVTLAQAQAWADKLPLTVIGADKKSYLLYQYEISIINMSPLQTTEYGTGNDGFPILARKAMDNMKPGDAVFLKDVMAKDETGKEIKIANLVFSIKE